MKTPGESLRIAKTYWKEAPVDVFALAHELGLGPVAADLPEQVSGLIRKRPDGSYEVVYNENQARVRQRFTIAHEIGHFIFHRERLGKGTSDTLAFRTDEHTYPNPEIGPSQEYQANNFASNLLIPDYYLKAAQATGLKDDAELAKRFDVSRAAMRIKLGLPPLNVTPSLFAAR